MLQERQKPKERTDVDHLTLPAREPASGVRARALILGIILVALTAKLVTQAELVVASIIHIGYLQFPPVALGLLLAAIAFNRLLGLISRKMQLTGSDLLVVYCMMLVGAMVSSHGVVQKWLPLLAALNYFNTPQNGWADKYFHHVPQSLMPWSTASSAQSPIARAFYEGAQRGHGVPWGAWVGPLFMWGALIVMILFSFLCLATILRRQWVDNEKLAFPLAQVPLELASDNADGAFYRKPAMWVGILIPVIAFGIKGMHQVVPTVPDIMTPTNINDLDALKLPPWNGLGLMPLTWSFAAVGFFFLLPADVLFSIWFFFVLTRGEEALCIAYNFPTPQMPMFPPKLLTGYQSMGAYFVLVGYLFWIARPHLKKVWNAAIGRERVDDTGEVMPYKVAVWGLLAGVVGAAVWLSVMGMSPWLALLELGVLIFVIAIVMARSTAEAGMMMTETTFRPIDIYRMFGSVHALGATNMTMLAIVDNLLLRDQRGLLLTGMLDSMRIADGTRIRRRAFAGVLSFAILLSMVVAVFIVMTTAYQLGANRLDPWMGTMSPQLSYNDYANYFSPSYTDDPNAHWQMPLFFSVGVVFCLFLTIMRTAFHWWPLHPLGYALAGSWTSVVFWFPCLIAWICKSLSLRYGGMAFYTKARPFFLGLVIGEFGMAVLYAVLNVLWKVPVPAFPWS